MRYYNVNVTTSTGRLARLWLQSIWRHYNVNATLSSTGRVLSSSVIVAVSGSLRLYIAFLFAGIQPGVPVCLAGGLIIYSTYTLDRAMGSREDAINRSEVAAINKPVVIAVCILSFLTGALLFAGENIYFASIYPFIIGYLYSEGITLGKHHLKLKGSAGVKNIVVGLTWGGTIAIVVSRWTGNILTVFSVFLFYGIKLFMNSVLYDIKDVEGDRAAGIYTLPICVGEKRMKKILLILCVILHLTMFLCLMLGAIMPETIILIYSFLVGITFISVYSPAVDAEKSVFKKYFREIMIDGESAVALSLRSIIHFLSSASVLYSN